MKKYNVIRIISQLLCLCIMSSTFVGTTLAKYTTAASAKDGARTAKWGFEINNKSIYEQPVGGLIFNLFDTLKDSDGLSDEADVTNEKIAPGTSGEFSITLKNTSEVLARCDMVYDLLLPENISIPLEFSTDGVTWNSINALGSTNPLQIGESKTISAKWRWPYEDGSTAYDENDTKTGINSAATPLSAKVLITFRITQVD